MNPLIYLPRQESRPGISSCFIPTMTHDSAAPAADAGPTSHTDSSADHSHHQHHNDHQSDSHHDHHHSPHRNSQHHHHHHHHHHNSDPEAGMPLPIDDSPTGRPAPPNYGAITGRRGSRNVHSSRAFEDDLLSGLQYIFPSVLLCLFILMVLYYFAYG
ncbi:hypothetical protein DL98DRAFT_43822 [Cadophora sp. DSE1049]|nr:hypothetical protein DL98DRAFT_43822 [Cadophora sp. DSE1049]